MNVWSSETNLVKELYCLNLWSHIKVKYFTRLFQNRSLTLLLCLDNPRILICVFITYNLKDMSIIPWEYNISTFRVPGLNGMCVLSRYFGSCVTVFFVYVSWMVPFISFSLFFLYSFSICFPISVLFLFLFILIVFSYPFAFFLIHVYFSSFSFSFYAFCSFICL